MIAKSDTTKKIEASTMLDMKSIFSTPLLVLNTLSLPPKIPDKEAPLFCIRMDTINRMAIRT
jgi:hypothetical protein